MEGIMVPLEEYLALSHEYLRLQWVYWITLALLGLSTGAHFIAFRAYRKQARTIAELYVIKAHYEKALRHVRGDVDKSVESGG
jgi:uncharacterized membrane protein